MATPSATENGLFSRGQHAEILRQRRDLPNILSRIWPRNFISELDGIADFRHFAAGETVLSSTLTDHPDANQANDLLAVLVSGSAKVEIALRQEQREIIGLLFPPNLIGIRFLSQYDPISVVAMTELSVACFDRTTFDQIASENPAFGKALLDMAIDEMETTRKWMLLSSRKSAREKIASFFLMLLRHQLAFARCGKRPVGKLVFDLPFKRLEMAKFLGTTKETVSREITSLRTEHIISMIDMHHFTVPDPQRLSHEAGNIGLGGAIAARALVSDGAADC